MENLKISKRGGPFNISPLLLFYFLSNDIIIIIFLK
jgi:hypothetical protein